jgi:hypothetical protein
MPAGARPGERRGGRQKGTKNRTTIERELLDQRQYVAEHVYQRAKLRGHKLAKETLDEFMIVFAAMATHYRPCLDGTSVNPNQNEEKFERWARLVIDAAKALAPYQSPTFRAIVVAPPPPENKGETVKRFSLKIFEHPAQLPGSNGHAGNGGEPPTSH